MQARYHLASVRIPQGLTKSTCWEALGGLLVALAFSVVLIVGLIILWEEPVVHGALPLGAYVAIAALAATLPCVLLVSVHGARWGLPCLHITAASTPHCCALSLQAFSGARGEPLTKAPRATERGQRIAAQAGQLGETGSFRNSLTAELHDNWKGATTLRQLFDGVVTRHGARPAQGTRRIEVRRLDILRAATATPRHTTRHSPSHSARCSRPSPSPTEMARR